MGGKLEKGWIASGVLSRKSGYPVTILSGVYNSLSGEGYDYTDVVPGTNWSFSGGRRRCQEIQSRFNPQAFTVNAIETWGDVAHNSVTVPGTFTRDLSFFRNFHIWEQFKLQYRLDGSNIL